MSKEVENEILKIEIRDLKEQLKDENTYHEEAIKWCTEAHKLAIENARLKKKIPSIIINNNYEWTLIEKGKNGVCVNYKLEKVNY